METKGDASVSRQCEVKNTLPLIIKRKTKDGKKSPTIGGTRGKGKVTCKVKGTEEAKNTKIVSTIGVIADNKHITGGEDRRSDSSLQGTPIETAAATTGNKGVAVFVSGKTYYQERGTEKHVVGNSFPKIISYGVESPIADRSNSRTSNRIAAATTLNSTDATFTAKTSDGVHSEGVTGYWEEDNNNGENKVSTARPDYGGNALPILEDAAPLLTATITEAGFQVAVGSRKGERTKISDEETILPRGQTPEALPNHDLRSPSHLSPQILPVTEFIWKG